MEDLDDIRQEFGNDGRKNPFIVPEGYFENFEERLHERMNVLMEPSETRVGRKILHPALAYFTGFCILVIAAVFVTRLMLVPHAPQLNSETNMANLVQYSIENIDEQTIIEALPKIDMDPAATEITNEEVVNYIQEQNIDLNSLNEEL
jgi:hypothetical protein